MAKDLSGRVAWRLAKAIRGAPAAAAGREGTATFVGRDSDGCGWVRLPGRDFETPANGGMLSDAEPGELVRWRIEGGRLSVTGNVTSPGVGASRVAGAVAPVAEASARACEQAVAASEASAAAADAAQEARETALDGCHLVITSTNGQLFKNGSESTVLQVAVFPNGGDRLDDIDDVRARFGAGAYVEWRWMHESSGEWGTLVGTDPHLSHGGMWLTVTPQDVATKTTFSASLVVPGEEA